VDAARLGEEEAAAALVVDGCGVTLEDTGGASVAARVPVVDGPGIAGIGSRAGRMIT
jgi:hypothetical protein